MSVNGSSNRLPVLAQEIKAAHEGVQDAARTAAERALEAGRALIEAETVLGARSMASLAQGACWVLRQDRSALHADRQTSARIRNGCGFGRQGGSQGFVYYRYAQLRSVCWAKRRSNPRMACSNCSWSIAAGTLKVRTVTSNG